MLKFSQPTSADHESLIIWLEFVVTTRQSFGLETVLDFTGQAHTDSFTSTSSSKQSKRYGGKDERL